MADPVGVSSISTFGLIVKGLQSIKDLAVGVEVKSKVTELYDVILAGQQAALEENIKQRALLDTVRELEEKIASMEAWDTEKQRYQLAPPWTGAVIYALKKSAGDTEPAHWICTTCYQQGKKSILNDVHKTPPKGPHELGLGCPVCNTYIPSQYSGGSIERHFADDMK